MNTMNTTSPDGALLHGETTAAIIRIFYRVYDKLGYGYVESVYCNAIAHELSLAAIAFQREVAIDVWYDGIRVGHFRSDFLVAGHVIVEVKASQTLAEIHRKQALNYLRGTAVEVGLLLHFGPKAVFQRLVFTNDRKPNLAAARGCP